MGVSEDDTLFPTTYVRDDLNLSFNKSVEEHGLSNEQKSQIWGHLENCERHAAQLLQLACGLGKVVLVTLAGSPWITQCCKHFYPRVGKILDELNVPIIYAAQDDHANDDTQHMMSCEQANMYC